MGYAELVKALKDSEHPEHETYMDWLDLENGEDFDPTDFSIEEVNKRLPRKL
jgi:thiaminase